jgi:hypothetical protein
MIKPRTRFLALASSCFALAGCGLGGPPDGTPNVATHPVKGKILLGDGKPLTGGRVYLVPEELTALQAQGDIGPDGTFALATLQPGDGAAPGTYKVRIEPAAVDVTAPKAAKAPKIAARYTDEDSSGLVVTIDANTSELEPIKLTDRPDARVSSKRVED